MCYHMEIEVTVRSDESGKKWTGPTEMFRYV